MNHEVSCRYAGGEGNRLPVLSFQKKTPDVLGFPSPPGLGRVTTPFYGVVPGSEDYSFWS